MRLLVGLVGAAVLGYILFAVAGGRVKPSEVVSSLPSVAVPAEAPPPPRDPAALIDATEDVDDLMPRYLTFELRRDAAVTFELDVVEGRGATAFVIRESERGAFEKSQENPIFNSFDHYRPFKVDNKLRHRAEGRLAAGRYLVAINEGSARNLFGGADKARVHVRVATP